MAKMISGQSRRCSVSPGDMKWSKQGAQCVMKPERMIKKLTAALPGQVYSFCFRVCGFTARVVDGVWGGMSVALKLLQRQTQQPVSKD